MSELSDLLDLVLEARLVDVHTALPGRVESYDAANQVADIKPMIKRTLRDASGEKVLEALPVIPSVPVAFMRGGGFFLALPLEHGDSGLLIFSERSIDRWRATGLDTDPGDQRLHGLSGAIFVPCVEPRSRALEDAPAADAMRLGADGGPVITITEDGVELGRSATEGIGLGDQLQSFLDDLRDWITTHTHAGVTVGVAASGPPAPADLATLPAVGTVASASHKVEP